MSLICYVDLLIEYVRCYVDLWLWGLVWVECVMVCLWNFIDWLLFWLICGFMYWLFFFWDVFLFGLFYVLWKKNCCLCIFIVVLCESWEWIFFCRFLCCFSLGKVLFWGCGGVGLGCSGGWNWVGMEDCGVGVFVVVGRFRFNCWNWRGLM